MPWRALPGRPRTRWRMLRVSGPSMVPTLRHGDIVVARVVRPGAAGGGIRVGDVVIARYRSMPDRLVVKTVAAVEGDGWWLASDNAAAGGDSSVHGVADVHARVIVRLRRASRPRLIDRRRT